MFSKDVIAREEVFEKIYTERVSFVNKANEKGGLYYVIQKPKISYIYYIYKFFNFRNGAYKEKLDIFMNVADILFLKDPLKLVLSHEIDHKYSNYNLEYFSETTVTKWDEIMSYFKKAEELFKIKVKWR